jgi:hypothetical protein
VTIRGKQAGRDVRFAVPVTLPERADDHPAIATVWARERIAELSRRLVRKVDPDTERQIERQIIELSIAHHVLTQLTAFVAVDRSHATAGGPARRVAVPVEIPDAAASVAAQGGGSYGDGVGYSGGGSGWGAIGTGHYGVLGSAAMSSASYGTTGARASDLHPRVATAPSVTIGAPMMMGPGGIDKAIIRRYVRRQLEKIQYCYEKRLLSSPKLTGTVRAHFTINGAGQVITATADGLGDAEVESCVAGVIQQVEFPRTDDRGVVQVNYPFTFVPATVPAPAPDEELPP